MISILGVWGLLLPTPTMLSRHRHSNSAILLLNRLETWNVHVKSLAWFILTIDMYYGNDDTTTGEDDNIMAGGTSRDADTRV